MMNSAADLLTQTEAAQFLNRSLRTLGLWREKGYGPAFVRIGGAVMYTTADLQEFIDRSRVVPERLQRVPQESGGQ